MRLLPARPPVAPPGWTAPPHGQPRGAPCGAGMAAHTPLTSVGLRTLRLPAPLQPRSPTVLTGLRCASRGPPRGLLCRLSLVRTRLAAGALSHRRTFGVAGVVQVAAVRARGGSGLRAQRGQDGVPLDHGLPQQQRVEPDGVVAAVHVWGGDKDRPGQRLGRWWAPRRKLRARWGPGQPRPLGHGAGATRPT